MEECFTATSYIFSIFLTKKSFKKYKTKFNKRSHSFKRDAKFLALSSNSNSNYSCNTMKQKSEKSSDRNTISKSHSKFSCKISLEKESVFLDEFVQRNKIKETESVHRLSLNQLLDSDDEEIFSERIGKRIEMTKDEKKKKIQSKNKREKYSNAFDSFIADIKNEYNKTTLEKNDQYVDHESQEEKLFREFMEKKYYKNINKKKNKLFLIESSCFTIKSLLNKSENYKNKSYKINFFTKNNNNYFCSSICNKYKNKLKSENSSKYVESENFLFTNKNFCIKSNNVNSNNSNNSNCINITYNNHDERFQKSSKNNDEEKLEENELMQAFTMKENGINHNFFYDKFCFLNNSRNINNSYLNINKHLIEPNNNLENINYFNYINQVDNNIDNQQNLNFDSEMNTINFTKEENINEKKTDEDKNEIANLIQNREDLIQLFLNQDFNFLLLEIIQFLKYDVNLKIFSKIKEKILLLSTHRISSNIIQNMIPYLNEENIEFFFKKVSNSFFILD